MSSLWRNVFGKNTLKIVANGSNCIPINKKIKVLCCTQIAFKPFYAALKKDIKNFSTFTDFLLFCKSLFVNYSKIRRKLEVFTIRRGIQNYLRFTKNLWHSIFFSEIVFAKLFKVNHIKILKPTSITIKYRSLCS